MIRCIGTKHSGGYEVLSWDRSVEMTVNTLVNDASLLYSCSRQKRIHNGLCWPAYGLYTSRTWLLF